LRNKALRVDLVWIITISLKDIKNKERVR